MEELGKRTIGQCNSGSYILGGNFSNQIKFKCSDWSTGQKVRNLILEMI